jgi:glycosyltransferase involved in cell wall biosynthesis
MLRRAARLIAVSPFVRDHALAEHAARVHIVPPGVDAEVFRPGPVPAGHDVLFVGPLDNAYRWKGLDTLWLAFRRVRALLPDARLVLVGDGDRRAELEQLARRDGLHDAVEFRGRLSLAALVQAYQEATVVTLPSVTDAESFGMVLAEANACGRPVVGTSIGGIPSFVRDGDNGLLVPPRDPHGLASALLQLLTDPERAEAMGQAGRERVVRDHDWAELAARTETLLLGAAGREPEAPERSAARGIEAAPTP